MTVELFTREGEYLTTVPGPAVSSPVSLPHTPSPPDVIVWGLRIFVLHREHGEYREASTFIVPLEKF